MDIQQWFDEVCSEMEARNADPLYRIHKLKERAVMKRQMEIKSKYGEEMLLRRIARMLGIDPDLYL